jgi:hypothetical protein
MSDSGFAATIADAPQLASVERADQEINGISLGPSGREREDWIEPGTA